MAMNDLSARGLWLCSARATSSLPVPDSPLSSTLRFDPDSRPMARNTSCIAGAAPMISGVGSWIEAGSGRWRRRCSTARRTRLTASSTSKGFGRYSNAPPREDATALSRSVCAVVMMTGISGALLLMTDNRSRPLTPGMRMSVMMASGRMRSSSSAMSFAESKLFTVMPAFSSAFSSTQRMERSSSITQTRFGLDMVVPPRQVERKNRLARTAGEFNQAAVPANDVLGNGKPETGAVGTAGDHRVKDMLLQVFGNTRAVVFDFDAQRQPMTFVADGELAFDACAQTHGAIVVHGLYRVAHDIQHRLNQLLAVTQNRRQTRVVIALHREPHRYLDQDELAHVFEYLVDVDQFVFWHPVRPDHPVHQVTQPIGLVNNDACVFFEFLVRQFLFKQLRRTAQAAERVFDFVCESAHHRAVRGLAVEH